MNIQNNAMLASLSVSMFGVRKTDKNESSALATAKQTTSDSVSVIKTLFPKEDIADIKMFATKARDIHRKYTLPWNDQGQRLLPTSVYSKYQSDMATIISDFDYTVNLFRNKYDDLLIDAQDRLGSLYNVDDYPSVDDVCSKFKINTSVSPLPKSDDFRIQNMSDADIQAVKKSYEVELQDKMKESQSSLLERLFNTISHLRDILNNDKGVFQKSSHDKIVELIELAPSLNVTNDPDIDALINRLSLACEVHNFDADKCRKHMSVRMKTAQMYNGAVEDILSVMGVAS